MIGFEVQSEAVRKIHRFWYRNGLQGAYERALKYCQERVSVGSPIADYKGIRWTLAEMGDSDSGRATSGLRCRLQGGAGR